MSEDSYLPRLDTLRALAVSIVVLYHLAPGHVAWGYIGVDIFFSLSGFLMTWLILKSGEQARSARQFLVNRFWRIYPPLLTTILATILTAMLLFSPEHLSEAAQTVFAALLALANIHFFGEAGYFDASSTVKPLLHTWSLGVEEQFYILFAIGLWALPMRFFPSALAILGLLSFALYAMVLLANTWPSSGLPQLHDDPVAALFFLPQYRFFQFAIGGLAAWFLLRRGPLAAGPEVVGAEVVGIILLISGLFAAGLDWAAPIAPVPLCLGMALLMMRSNLLDWLARIHAVAYLARISYQLYLVHWPVIVFAQYFHLRPLEPGGMLVCAGLSLILGDLLYRMTNAFRIRS